MIFILRDKNLVRTVNHPVFRFETGADELVFIIPEKYRNTDLSECIPVVEVNLPCDEEGNTEFFYTNWKYDETPYKEGFLSLTIPINSQLTQFAGTVDVWLMFVKVGKPEDETPSDDNNNSSTDTGSGENTGDVIIDEDE